MMLKSLLTMFMIFRPPIEGGICINVNSPKSISIVARLPYPESPCYKFDVKLNGIHTPNIYSLSEEEKSIAYLAKKELENIVKMKQIQLKNVRNGKKNGQLIADVYCENIYLNQYLLDNRLAIDKCSNMPESWLDYYRTI
jgi:Staphylococcal nuclease homologue